jgi:hypothetical protein
LLSLSKGIPEALLREIVIFSRLAFFLRERTKTKSCHAVKRDG